MSAYIRIDATFPVRRLDRAADGDHDDRQWRLTERRDLSVKVNERVPGRGHDAGPEATEKIAERLVDVVEDQSEFVRGLDPSYADDFDRDTYNVQWQDAEVTVDIGFAVESVYLAARKVALERTKRDMCRRGTSVENVLIGWMNGDDAYSYKDTEIKVTGLADHARYALYGYCLTDHTVGGGIDYDAVPEEMVSADLDRSEMLPEVDNDD